jgi:hypothetical protein
MHSHDQIIVSQRANKAKLEQLIRDAETKSNEAGELGETENMNYWGAFADGLRRALNVVNGNG